jgi:hypothetical protein
MKLDNIEANIMSVVMGMMDSISDLKKEVKKLKKNSHAPKDFICCDCGCKLKRDE